jgi:hypothetical protein
MGLEFKSIAFVGWTAPSICPKAVGAAQPTSLLRVILLTETRGTPNLDIDGAQIFETHH